MTRIDVKFEIKTVDVIILSLCNTPEAYQMNMNCLSSLIASEEKYHFNIFMVESNKDFLIAWSYPFANVKLIFPDGEFNYNKYVNATLKLTKADFVCVCNNDLIFQRNWFSEIQSYAGDNRKVLSFSPNDPNSVHQQSALTRRRYSIGYRVRSEIVGWCLVMKRQALDLIYPLDETFDYYYQDNDYAYCLRKNNILHALVGTSIVNHIENMTSNNTPDFSYSTRGKSDEIKFINKWGTYKSLSRKNRIHKYINFPWLRPLSRFIYSKMVPYWSKSVAASLQGWRLNCLRYGPDTAALVAEALQRETWCAEQWQEWQQNRMKTLLKGASLYVPYYRDHWKEYAGTSATEDIRNWPVLDKQSLRAEPDRFVSDLADRRRLNHTFTSGSTGTPLKVYWSAATARRWYALFEARWRNWHGVNRHDRWALIGGKQIVRPDAKSPPYWVFNYGMNQLYLSAYHLSPDSASSYVGAMIRYQVRYVYSYTSGIYALARFIAENGLTPPKLDVVITNAEPLFAHQRDLIASVFGCPVRETYGMAEMVAGAGECDHGHMHVWPDAAYLEVVDPQGVTSKKGMGQLLGTSLLNPDMPLIRYRIGDTVSLASEDTTCACGRTLPILNSIEGRNDDLLYSIDGRAIGRLDPIFKSSYPIRESQIIQKSLDRCLLRIVPAKNYDPAIADEIAFELKEKMGNIIVDIELLDSIPRGSNGKFKAVISEIKILNSDR